MTITAGELKASLAELPDDLEIFAYDRSRRDDTALRELETPVWSGVGADNPIVNLGATYDDWALMFVGGPVEPRANPFRRIRRLELIQQFIAEEIAVGKRPPDDPNEPDIIGQLLEKWRDRAKDWHVKP